MDMLKMSRKVEYALMILKYTEEHAPQGVSARMICEKFGIPFDTTSKVMQQLARHHILISHQGVKGGYELKTSLQKISLLKLAEIIEGKTTHFDCLNGSCNLSSQCNINHPIEKLNKKLIKYFNSLNLYELLKG